MAWKRGACAGATGRKSPWSSLPLPEGASEFVPHYAVAVAVDGRFSIGCGTIALVLGGEGRHKGRVRIQIDGGVPVPIGEVDQIAGIQGTLEGWGLGTWVMAFHPHPGAFVFVQGMRWMVRFVQDPMFPTVQGFGESWSVLVPLNAAPSVANPKRQCYKVRVNARGAGGEFVVAQEGFPFVRVSFPEQVPALVGELVGRRFWLGFQFLQVLRERDSPAVFRQSVGT